MTMVDSQTDRAMADQIADLRRRVSAVEQKVDLLSASVDRRFNAVDEALLEQRQYTEFAFSRLESKMDTGDARIDAKIDSGFARMDARFERLERKLDRFIDTQS